MVNVNVQLKQSLNFNMRLYPILFACVTGIAVAQTAVPGRTPPMSTTPPTRLSATPLISVVPIMNSGTIYYDPEDKRFYNPQRTEPDFSNLKPPPMGWHYEIRDKTVVIIRN